MVRPGIWSFSSIFFPALVFCGACTRPVPVRPEAAERLHLEAPIATGRDTALAYERFLQAELKRIRGKACEAADHYRQALEMSYTPPQLLVRFAGALAACGRPSRAAQILESISPRDRDKGPYWLTAAEIFAAQGREEERLAALEKAVRLEKDDIAPLLALAGAVDDPERKRELLTMAVVRQPGSDEAHLELAQLHLEQGRPHAARRQIDAYLRLRPDRKEAVLRRFGDAP